MMLLMHFVVEGHTFSKVQIIYSVIKQCISPVYSTQFILIHWNHYFINIVQFFNDFFKLIDFSCLVVSSLIFGITFSFSKFPLLIMFITCLLTNNFICLVFFIFELLFFKFNNAFLHLKTINITFHWFFKVLILDTFKTKCLC